MVRGEILANVWGLNTIVRIDPRSWQVLGHLELSVCRSHVTTITTLC
jgi:glutamine cyclotransferase